MGSNTNSYTGNTSLKVAVTERTSTYKTLYFRELKNEVTGYALSIT